MNAKKVAPEIVSLVEREDMDRTLFPTNHTSWLAGPVFNHLGADKLTTMEGSSRGGLRSAYAI